MAHPGIFEGAMEPRTGVVERAFQIAKSGDVASVTALRLALAKEGYANSAQAMAGRSIRAQLARMITEAQTARGRAMPKPDSAD
jgi:hypothetical protein